MTPELPFALISDARAAAFATPAAVVSPDCSATAAAALIVSDMFVPVSPSGTGKTLMALSAAAWLRSAAAPALKARARAGPSMMASAAGAVSASFAGGGMCGELPHARIGCYIAVFKSLARYFRFEGEHTHACDMRSLRQRDNLRPQHPTPSLRPLGARSAQDEPHVQAEPAPPTHPCGWRIGARQGLHAVPAEPDEDSVVWLFLRDDEPRWCGAFLFSSVFTIGT